MRLATFAAFSLLALPLCAGTPTMCYDGDTDRLFSTDLVIPQDWSIEKKMPQIEYDPDSRPAKLTLQPRPADITVEWEEIGNYRGNIIHRVVYREKSKNAELPRPACVMFAYDTRAPNGDGIIRPFFILSGEQLRWFDSHFASDIDWPFSLEISRTLQGNGVYWKSYSFIFTTASARIVERSEGGRKVNEKTYFYDKSGKVVRTRTEKSN